MAVEGVAPAETCAQPPSDRIHCAYADRMVKVANDGPLIPRELPAEDSVRSTGSLLPASDSAHRRSDPSSRPGITLAELVTLPSAGEGRLQRPRGEHRSVITRTCWLQRAAAHPDHCRHAVILADAAQLGPLLDLEPDTVGRLADAEAAALVVGGASPDLSRHLVTLCERAFLPLLLVPDGRLERLNSEILGAVLDHQQATLGRIDALHEALVQVVLTGGSVQDVCRQVAAFFGGAVMVTTTDGRVLATAGTDAEIAWAQSLDCFDRTGRLITEQEPTGPRPPGPDAHRAAVRIVAGAMDHGLLLAFSRDRMLGLEDIRLLERASTVAALAIAKEQAVSAIESKYRAEFLRDALAGRAGPASKAIEHAASLDWDIDRPLVVVVAEMDEDGEEHDTEETRFLQQRFARAWTHAVGVRDTASPVMGFSREVVTVLGIGDPEDNERAMRAVGDLVRVVRGDGGGGRRSFSTGVSRGIRDVEDLPRAYQEALNAVTVGRQMHGFGAVTHVDGLGIYRLLALIPDSAQLRRFVQDSLGVLATDDSPEYADLRRTLEILIDTNMNVAETARQLFFHYNTLRYRIAKLEKMLGPFTEDPEVRLTLALALKVHQMKGI